MEMCYEDEERQENSVIQDFRITATDEKSYNTKHYNLQAIIAVGFKVNNDRAVRFRKWSGQIVKDYTIQGWTMDKERFKKGHMFTDEYFERQPKPDPRPLGPFVSCGDCPYISQEFICYRKEGDCMRTHVKQIHEKNKGGKA